MKSTQILIVEDEAIVAADLAAKLDQLGYRLAGIARHGRAAISLALRLRPHLVLMDIQLSGPTDGIQAAEAIREQYDVPVIYLTAHSDPATLARAKITGPSGYILKPYDERELATQIELVLYKHAAERKVREQREWLQGTLASIGDAVIATDAEGRITFLNPVAEALTGWPAEEAVGRLLGQVLNVVNEFTKAPVDDPVANVLQHGHVVGMADHSLLIGRNGRSVPIDDSCAPIRSREGEILGVVLVFRDIRERREAEAAMRRLNENLEKEVAERTQLAEARTRQLQALASQLIQAEDQERRRIADLLHDDLQQILAAARLHMEEFRAGTAPEPKLAYIQQLMETAILKSRQLSQDLSPPVLMHCDLAGTLQWLVGQMRKQFGLEVSLKADVTPQLNEEPFKSFLFRAVKEHLFNVTKHAGVKQARVELANADDRLVITVSDEGRGFDPAMLIGQDVKYGLGLSRVRERVRAIGGDLEIDSAPGAGSRFILSIPLRHTRVDAAATLPEAIVAVPPPEPSVVTASGVVRVLFADDHRVMRKGLIQLLSNQTGIEVVGEAENGREAVEKTRRHKPDVVVMDISMPVMDGIEATRLVKAEMPEVRVVGLSMHEDEQIAAQLKAAGAEQLVNKAASLTELLSAIHGTPAPVPADGVSTSD